MSTPEEPTEPTPTGNGAPPARFTWVIVLQVMVAVASFILWIYRLVTGDSKNAYETWWPLVIAVIFGGMAFYFWRDRSTRR